jgi:hypothetical protein
MIVTHCEEAIAPFMESMCHSHGAFMAGRGIGLLEAPPDDGGPVVEAQLIAACWYEGWNGANMNIHVAALPNRRWMTRDFLWYVFHYPFVECGVKRLTGLVASTNHAARRFDEHIGFTLEATLKDAAPDGDMLVYRMFKDECRWLNIRRKPPIPEGVH